MKRIIKNWADLENAKTEYEKSVNKDEFIENCVFDTSVKLNNDTGAAELSLDLQDILANGYYTNFGYYVLENTMKSFKNKKSKALFVNTVMRKIGTDMRVDSRANVTLYGKQTYNDVLWFVNGMFHLGDKTKELLDSDAMVIYNIWCSSAVIQLPHQYLIRPVDVIDRNDNDKGSACETGTPLLECADCCCLCRDRNSQRACNGCCRPAGVFMLCCGAGCLWLMTGAVRARRIRGLSRGV